MKNKKIKTVLIGCFIILLELGVCSCQADREKKDYTTWVNPFIGTLHEGHCSPAATVPMGMVQPGPESHSEYYTGYEMDHVVGYQYTDSLLKGFTQTHLNGVGCPAMSDILMMPFSRNVNNDELLEAYYSDYDKNSEVASPGYYAVRLLKNDVGIELTASSHVAYHQYCFGTSTAHVLVDLQYGVNWNVNELNRLVLESSEQFDDDFTLSGYRQVGDWTTRKIYYTIKFNKRIINKKLLESKDGEKAKRFVLSFDMGGDSILQAKVALSTTGIEGAKRNMKAEIPNWDCFTEIRNTAKEKWNTLLGGVDIQGSEEQMFSFYTSLYRLYIQPNNIANVDGTYRAENDSVYCSRDKKFYSTFSLWDTFRAVHPMYTILTPDFVKTFVNSLMEAYSHKLIGFSCEAETSSYLPRWGLWGRETNTMIANHAVPVIVEAYCKGLLPDTYSLHDIFQAIYTSVSEPHYRNHVELIDKYGYIPYDVQLSIFDDGRETVSRLLEGIYDDYCVGIMAQGLKKDTVACHMARRAGLYRNVYNPKTGFMCGRNARGEFKTEDPTEVVGEWLPQSSYTEGNSWHYLFHVLHDIPGMINLMGGKERFAQKLDSMFYATQSPEVKTLQWKILGTLGQYWHGNEPCHHVPFLYKFTDEGYKTDAILHYLTTEFYKNAPDGLKGNDDCGQMSAWYMFASLGFYPIDPVSRQFLLGAPQVKEAKLYLKGNKCFTIKVDRKSSNHIFVKQIYLNGKLLHKPFITYEEIMSGGELRFVMEERADIETLMNFKIQ